MIKPKRKIALTLIIFLLVLPALGFWLWLRNYADKSIVDEAGVIKDSEPFLIDTYILKKYSGINFRIVTKKSLKSLSIDEAGDREFAIQRRWSSMNPERAAMFFIAPEEKGVRLRFGDELMPAFDEQFVKFIQEEQLGPHYFDESMPWELRWDILSGTLNIILSNIFNSFPLPPEVAMQGELPPVARHLIQDEAGIIKRPLMTMRNLLQLRKNLQIDFRIATVRSLAGKDINIEANKKFEELRIGSNTVGGRGLLLFIAPQEQLVRLEVGYDLEDIYTDRFVGYIEREQMAPYFKSGRVFFGITDTVVTIAKRGFEKILGDQSASISSSEDATYRSSGAGAKLETVIGSEEARPEKIFLPESIKKEFKAGNTPVETFLKFLEACQQHINDTTLGIYTKESQIFLSNEVISNLEMGRVAEAYTDAAFEKKIKGNRAIFKFERYPPIFFRESSQGWQIDLATMDRAGIMFFKVFQNTIFEGLSCVTNPYRFAYPDFRYKRGKQPEFLTKGIDENGPWLGVTLGFFRSGDVKGEGLLAGGFIIEVCPESPAAKAGLQYGDIIVIINGRKGTYAELIPKIISSSAIGDKLDIYFYRESKGYKTQAMLEKNQNADFF
jgi:uncharacterized membrane protein YgcG